MSENQDRSQRGTTDEAATRAETRSAEAAAIRRRWITLGEALAVIAVVISALTLWNNWNERAVNEANTRAQAHSASVKSQTLVLIATLTDDRVLALKPASPHQSVQAQAIAFPRALGLAPVQTTGEPRIEADWFAKELEKARNAAGMPDDSRGDERLPVTISTTFLVDGKPHEDVAIYDIGYTIAGRWLSGHTLKLRGVSLKEYVGRKAAQAKLDARWSTMLPKKK